MSFKYVVFALVIAIGFSFPISDLNVNVETENIIEESIVDKPIYYDIPLTNEEQDFTMNQASYMNVPYELVLSIMEVESEFRTDVISATNDYGIMQINKSNFKTINEVYGITDMLDIENNIVSGIYFLSDAMEQGVDLHECLMVYNMGISKAREYWQKGIYETAYSRKVVEVYETYGRTK